VMPQIKDWRIETWTHHLKEHYLKYSKMDKKNPKCPFLMRIKIFHIYSVVFLLPLFFIENFFVKLILHQNVLQLCSH
jgi:hypothetical protein